MKKTKVIALVLCAAIMMMGAGYAYWTDTLTINNTVSTGELNVEFLGTGVTNNDPYANITWATADAVNEVNNVSILTTNLYPGASVGFNTTIANTGTIPAVLKPVGFTNPVVASLTNANGVALTQVTPDEKAKFFVTGTVSYDGHSVTIPANTVNLSNIETINYYLPQTLPAGKSVIMNLTLTLDPALTGDTLENKYVNTVMTLNFKQHNDPAAQ